ncbi:unnamed protein product [Zymoseptoria tritici ST99CH_3D1]|uniref:Yeast cell wall synthesis Kre9/Knh1-like N-terminal domain-containing protein n=2 Tax=Zymoseptoria tritici TaxID=1047171 RepID=A0A1X7S8T8_ZYMT9|nr:unnamed protein product [Zymoseptoria tritici ST99CH_3D7]SMR61880.1 unnamed protein product [Zymoseptoria tritici ST99CH_1E4]SMR64383.1 unnamed protein product [Zymoseptoria tritici ST99CH_3D1]
MLHDTHFRSLLHVLLSALLLIPTAHAGLGITFVTPAAGSTWPAGPFTVSWQDSHSTPSMSDLVSYTLTLLIGGNSDTTSQTIRTIGEPNSPVSEGKVVADIPANVSASSQNGFYLKMVANTTSGSEIVNYSNRFTLIGLNGTTDETYLAAAQAANGANDVPAAYSIVSPTITSSSSSATSTPTSTARPAPPPPPPTSDRDPEKGSTGVNVGLVIGGIFAIIGFISIIIWILLFVRRRRTRKSAKTLSAKEASANRRTQVLLDYKAELSADNEMRRSTTAGELSPDAEMFEMEGQKQRAVEMQAKRDTVRYELQGSVVELEAGSGRRSRLAGEEDGSRAGRFSWRQSLQRLSGDHRRSRDVQPPPPPV